MDEDSWRELHSESYVQKNMTILEISRELGCANSTVSNNFRKYGLPMRKAAIRPTPLLAAINWDKVYGEMYVNRELSHQEIANDMGCSESYVRINFTKRSLKSRKQTRRRPKCQDNVFSKWNSEMAYWAGFLAADGSLHKNCETIQIKLSDIDEAHVRHFADFIGINQEMVKFTDCKYQNGRRRQVMLNFTNKRIYDDLIKIGIKPGKKFRDDDIFKMIPEKYRFSFSIDIFDGDGSISFSKSNNHWVIQFYNGSKATVTSFIETFKSIGVLSSSKIYKRKDAQVYSMSWCRLSDTRIFANEYLKLDSSVTLGRKREKIKKLHSLACQKSINHIQ